MRPDGSIRASGADGNPAAVSPDQTVSMNLWGLSPAFFSELEDGFEKFLRGLGPDDIRSEYLLPSVIGNCIREGRAGVKVLESHDRWFGVTYREDKQAVVDSVKKLIEDGVYPEKLR